MGRARVRSWNYGDAYRVRAIQGNGSGLEKHAVGSTDSGLWDPLIESIRSSGLHNEFIIRRNIERAHQDGQGALGQHVVDAASVLPRLALENYYTRSRPCSVNNRSWGMTGMKSESLYVRIFTWVLATTSWSVMITSGSSRRFFPQIGLLSLVAVMSVSLTGLHRLSLGKRYEPMWRGRSGVMFRNVSLVMLSRYPEWYRLRRTND